MLHLSVTWMGDVDQICSLQFAELEAVGKELKLMSSYFFQ